LNVTVALDSMGAGAQTATTAVNNVVRPMRFKQHLRFVNRIRLAGFKRGTGCYTFQQV
jgi:hypothetical protein